MDKSVPPLLLDLFQAYYDARKNKRKTVSVLRFELDFEARLFALYEDIISHKYEILPSVCFIVTKPVQREIIAADFRDRIVHHLLYNYLSPLCERLFINDSYSCRIGRGTSYGIKRADHFIRSCSRNYTTDCFVLKLDISGYFTSMNRSLLYNKVRLIIERFHDTVHFDTNLVLWLLQKIIFHDHTLGCIINGSRSDWIGLPQSKSLFCARPDCGLPIGNLTSQLFGNIYLNDFDHFVVRDLGCKRYGRYVDDILLVHQDKEVLKQCILRIRQYLWQELSLHLHPKKIYLQHYTKGVDFLGASMHPYRIYPRHRLKGNMYQTIMYWNQLVVARKGKLTREQLALLCASLCSYLGTLGVYRTRHLRQSMLWRLSPFILHDLCFGSPYRKIKYACFQR